MLCLQCKFNVTPQRSALLVRIEFFEWKGQDNQTCLSHPRIFITGTKYPKYDLSKCAILVYECVDNGDMLLLFMLSIL